MKKIQKKEIAEKPKGKPMGKFARKSAPKKEKKSSVPNLKNKTYVPYSKKSDEAPAVSSTVVRINKHMADIGLSSRRQADELIDAGSVLVNGKKAVRGQKIDTTKDKVELKGKQGRYVYYAYNKPVGIITTGAQGEEVDILNHTDFKKPVFPVGRLDKDSQGLILMTDDRRITHRLLDPKFEHEKEYRVTLKGKLSQQFINNLAKGVMIEGVRTKPAEIMRESDKSFRIILTEGRNRQIRRMVEAGGEEVEDLLRIRIEHIKLNDLKPGSFRSLSGQELATLLRKLGLK